MLDLMTLQFSYNHEGCAAVYHHVAYFQIAILRTLVELQLVLVQQTGKAFIRDFTIAFDLFDLISFYRAPLMVRNIIESLVVVHIMMVQLVASQHKSCLCPPLKHQLLKVTQCLGL